MDDEDDDDDDEEEDKEKVELKKVNRPKPKSKTYKKREKKDKFTCNYCDRKFFDKTDMDEHIVMAHTKEFRYYCDTCGKGYYMLCKKKYCEQRHERKTFKDEVLRGDSMWKNPKESNNWLCHYCSKMFFNPATYHRHLKKHANGTEVFKCEMCSKWLSSSYNLNAHMKLHTGERNAVCETCGSKYRTVGELNVHRAKVHGLKQKRFKCRICDKEFKYFPYLKKHFVNYHPNDNIPESSEMFKITDKETEKDETIIIVSGGEDDTDTDSDNTTQVYSISVDDVIL